MKQDQRKQFGRRLKAARISARYSQEDAAELLGITRQSVSAWETGASCPSALQLASLAANYCVCAHSLLFGEAYVFWKLRPMVRTFMEALDQRELSTGE